MNWKKLVNPIAISVFGVFLFFLQIALSRTIEVTLPTAVGTAGSVLAAGGLIWLGAQQLRR